MLIILEGPNGVGKTTLAKQLVKQYNLKYIKESKPNGGAQYYLEKALEYDDAVVDRFHLGEYVYPMLKKDGRDALLLWQQHLIERILQIKGAILLYCNTSFDFKKNIFETRGEDYVNVNEIEKEENYFNICFERSILQKYKIDFIKDNFLLDLENVDYNKYKKYESIGSINNSIMLIGEKYGGNTKFSYGKEMNKTFTNLHNSSRFLHEALSLMNYNNFYLTNAYKTLNEDKDLELLKEEINLINPYKIIALGNKTEKLIKKLNIKYYKIPHPQYYFRFHHDKQLQYKQLLEEIIYEQ
ncbi:MAG: AAA family ATPase [Candidatus Nanoarchaeia archaeon]|jgi:hypothetical protein|nr:AAA family ATPase [Candidatus Nanoarchaeia archaeon]